MRFILRKIAELFTSACRSLLFKEQYVIDCLTVQRELKTAISTGLSSVEIRLHYRRSDVERRKKEKLLEWLISLESVDTYISPTAHRVKLLQDVRNCGYSAEYVSTVRNVFRRGPQYAIKISW